MYTRVCIYMSVEMRKVGPVSPLYGFDRVPFDVRRSKALGPIPALSHGARAGESFEGAEITADIADASGSSSPSAASSSNDTGDSDSDDRISGDSGGSPCSEGEVALPPELVEAQAADVAAVHAKYKELSRQHKEGQRDACAQLTSQTLNCFNGGVINGLWMNPIGLDGRPLLQTRVLADVTSSSREVVPSAAGSGVVHDTPDMCAILAGLIERSPRREAAAKFLISQVGSLWSAQRRALRVLNGRRYDASALREALSRFPETRALSSCLQ